MPTYAQFRAQQAAKPPEPPDDDITNQLTDLLARGGMTALEAAMPVFDILARPQTALSEAYGAYKGGEENELLAAMRGLTEGWEGAKYGTFGEQFVPHEEGEEFGRKAARFGVDVVTDPVNLLLFTGPGRTIISKGLQKTVTPALKKTGEVLKRQPWAQRAGRMVVPYSKLWGMFGDEAGEIGGRLGTEGFEAIGIREGRVFEELKEMLKSTGLAKDAAKRKALSDALEGAVTDDEGIKAMRDWMRLEYDKMARDAVDVDLKVWNPQTDELVDFADAIEPNYLPRMLRRGAQDEIDEFIMRLPLEEAERLAAFRGPKASKLRAAIAKQLKISDDEAEQVLREFSGRPPKVGHLEYARTRFPEEMEQFLERDAVEIFTRYMERAIPRIEMARRFGPKYEIMDDLLARSMQAGPNGVGISRDIAMDIRQIIRGVVPASRYGLDDMLRGALAIQTMGKLGFTTSLMNFGQKINTGIKEGVGKMFSSIGAEMSPGVQRRYAYTYTSGVREHLRLMTGSAGTTRRLPRYAQKYLHYTLFTPIEGTNRVGSGWAGVQSAQDMIHQWINLAKKPTTPKRTAKMNRLRNTVREYGVPDEEFDEFRRLVATGQRAQFRPDIEDIVGYRASQIAQHATTPWELPPAWRTPEMRVFLQFKRFAYNQTRFLYEQVAKPAYKWLETNGVEGDIMPFIRTAGLLPPAGVAVGTGREVIKDLQAWFVGAKRRPSRYDFDNHPTASTLRGMMYVGSFGVAGDLLERAFRSGLSDYFLGPTVSDLMDVTERTVKGGYKKFFTEEEGPGIEDMLLSMYRVAGRGPLGMSPRELLTASTRRGLPGLVREQLP